MSTSIIHCCIQRQRVIATFLGLAMLFAWPVSGQTIYPVEPPEQKADLQWLSKVAGGSTCRCG